MLRPRPPRVLRRAQSEPSRAGELRQVTVDEAATLSEQGAILLDVREADEWTAGHAPGARHVPLADLPSAVPALSGSEVLTICRSGRRSAGAALLLTRSGVPAANVDGGMSAWAAHGLPVVRDDGSAGAVV